MPRFFNTTGPCDPADHYMLAPEQRMPALLPFIEQKLYFVAHAARQTGKTTAMRAFAARLRGLGYAAVWATLEEGQGIADIERAEPLWVDAISSSAAILPEAQRPPPTGPFREMEVGARLRKWLQAWSRNCPVPVVLLLDEADTVSGAALISLLRQLRAGFMDRGVGKFPVSVGLIGMRDLRDYLTESKDGVQVNPGSPFNVKSASVTLRNFNEAEVAALYAQHTADTGQPFTPDAVAAAFHWSQGQPFLVNALARIAVMELADGQPVTAAHIHEAKERLILSRTTHLDALGQRLKEPRVARVVQPVLLGDMQIPYDTDDYVYCVDLGLIRRGLDGAEAANPLYREVLVRELTYNRQMNLPRPWWRWQTASGGLDMAALIGAFLVWWRENAEMVVERAAEGYLEAVAHLAFMAFLQRVVNGGGRVHREFAAGREALDLLVEYGGERHAIELKRVPPRHSSLERVRQRGQEQTAGYLDTLGLDSGWLIIFDQRAGLTWEQKLWTEDVTVQGKTVRVRGA